MFNSPDVLPPTENKKEEKKQKATPSSWWCLSGCGGSGRDHRDPVPSADVEEGMGGLSDFYGHNSGTNNQEQAMSFQSGDGLNAGTLEMRRRKDNRPEVNSNSGGGGMISSSNVNNTVSNGSATAAGGVLMV